MCYCVPEGTTQKGRGRAAGDAGAAVSSAGIVLPSPALVSGFLCNFPFLNDFISKMEFDSHFCFSSLLKMKK